MKTWFLKILSVSESGPTYRCINLYIFKFFPVPVSTAKDAQSIFGTDIVFSGKNLMLGKTHKIFFLIKPLRWRKKLYKIEGDKNEPLRPKEEP